MRLCFVAKNLQRSVDGRGMNSELKNRLHVPWQKLELGGHAHNTWSSVRLIHRADGPRCHVKAEAAILSS
jgi:hypothetical protein